MNERSVERFAEIVRDSAASFEYPPTPDVAGEVRGRLSPARAPRRPAMRWALVAILVLIIGLLVATAVPPVRAALLKILHIGAIQISLLEDPQASAGMLAEQQALSITDLGEAMSLEEAGAHVTLRDPAYPPALGRPDAIYGQNLLYREPVISFFWRATRERPPITLTQIEIPNFAFKWVAGEQVLETEILGQPAVWIEGPHLLDLGSGQVDQVTRVATNVLIWNAGEATYRLEGEISLEEAREIAESWP